MNLILCAVCVVERGFKDARGADTIYGGEALCWWHMNEASDGPHGSDPGTSKHRAAP